MSVKYYSGDNTLLRRQSPDHWPEIYRGKGRWEVYKDMFKFDHEADEITPEQAQRTMAVDDK